MDDKTMADREPGYSPVFRTWYWRCANRDAPLAAVLAHSKNLIPWPIYWGMSGAKGGYLAEYPTREAALEALRHGVRNQDYS